MSYRLFDEFIQSHLKIFYSFSYALIPDELQSRQLVIDGLNSYVLEELPQLAWSIDGQQEMDFERERAREAVLSKIYKLGARRWGQLQTGLILPKGKMRAFYLLELQERACLFAFERLAMEASEIGALIEEAPVKVSQLLNNARQELAKSLGRSFEWIV